MEWKSRTTYTARLGHVEGVVEQPDASGFCRTLVRVYDGSSAQTVHRSAFHGLTQAKNIVAGIMEDHAAIEHQ